MSNSFLFMDANISKKSVSFSIALSVLIFSYLTYKTFILGEFKIFNDNRNKTMHSSRHPDIIGNIKSVLGDEIVVVIPGMSNFEEKDSEKRRYNTNLNGFESKDSKSDFSDLKIALTEISIKVPVETQIIKRQKFSSKRKNSAMIVSSLKDLKKDMHVLIWLDNKTKINSVAEKIIITRQK